MMLVSKRLVSALSGLLLSASSVHAQVSLVGDWSSRIHEDPTRTDPSIGDFAGLPMTPQALAHADTWTESRLTLIERQCVPNGASWAFRGPCRERRRGAGSERRLHD